MTSPEDTYERLRRADYNLACAEFTMVCIGLPLFATSEELASASGPTLKRLGWTYNDLVIESRKRENEFN